MQQMDTQCRFSGPFASSVGITFNLKPFRSWLKLASADVTAWNALLETGQKEEKEDSFALMMKTPKDTSVAVAKPTKVAKPTAIWDIKKWRTFHNWLYKTSKQHVRKRERERKKKDFFFFKCNNRIPHIACHLPHKRHTVKWCPPSQTMISIPSLMWRPRGTLKRLAREMHTRKYSALYKG